MPGAAVVIPWRPGCPHREAAWAWVRARYEPFGWQIVEGSCGTEEWCKAAAVADGIRNTDAEVLVVADADVWTDAIPVAVAAVSAGAGWVVPRCDVRRLTEQSTEEVLDGSPLGPDLALEQRPYPGVYAGGIIALSHQAWRTAPLDARFLGWGSEDEAWTYALSGLVGRPLMLDQPCWPLWHLWHPPQPRHSRSVGSAESDALRHRYRAVRGNRRRLQALVDEGRPA